MSGKTDLDSEYLRHTDSQYFMAGLCNWAEDHCKIILSAQIQLQLSVSPGQKLRSTDRIEFVWMVAE